MSEIKVGDLVVVVRSHPHRCPLPISDAVRKANIGKWIFVVSEIALQGSRCPNCQESFPPVLVAWGCGPGGVIDLFRLKRIPPLSELEDEKRDEEITA